MKLPALALALALAASPAEAQILVAPLQVFLRPSAPLATFIVENQSGKTQEVSIGFRFGYPVSDALGGLSMAYGDTLALKDRSMQDWVRAFPRQFTLTPGQRQEVRITARPPAGQADGVYFTRLVTTSAPQSAPVDSVAPGIKASVVFRLEQVTTVLFERGRVFAAVSADTPTVTVDSVVAVRVHLAPTGTAPFFGTTSVRIRAADGREVGNSSVKYSMYVPMVQSHEFARSALPPGTYSGELRITSDRDDIAPQDLHRIDPVVRRFTFSVP